MKKIWILFVSILFIMLPHVSHADGGYVINNFSSNISVLSNGNVQVNESIIANFDIPKHGIYRILPYKYSDGTYTEINDISVNRDSSNEPYSTSKDNGYVTIKIGDENKTIVGSHTYVISYTFNGVLKNIGNQDELYLNITGNEWDTTINHADATILTPDDVPIINISCYQGQKGSTDSCLFEKHSHSVTFSTDNLVPGQGLTAAVSWSQGLIKINQPIDSHNIWKYMIFVIPLIFLIISCIFWFRKWQKVGRDPEMPRSIVVEYQSPIGVFPLHAGIIFDNKADTVDVASEIIEFARRGYIVIEEVKGNFLGFGRDYVLKRTGKIAENLSNAEDTLLSGLFKEAKVDEQGISSVKLSSLKNDFYKILADVKTKAKEEVAQLGYFTRIPYDTSNKKYIFLVIFIFLLAKLGFHFFKSNDLYIMYTVILSLIVLLIPALIYYYYSPQLTTKGAEIKYKLLGYKMFIETAEKYRAKFYEDQNIIFEVMPYVVMFGLADKFAKSISKMDIPPVVPIWYVEINPMSFSNFTHDMSTFSSRLGSTMASAPGSSGSGGGGFSGGGFGGGGGGSW